MEHMGMSTTFQLLWFLISTGEHGQSLIVQEIVSFAGWLVSFRCKPNGLNYPSKVGDVT